MKHLLLTAQHLIKLSGDELLALLNKMTSGIWFILVVAGLLPQFPATALIGRTYSVMGGVAGVLMVFAVGLQVYDAGSVKHLISVRQRVIFPIGLLFVGLGWWVGEVAAYVGRGVEMAEIRPFLCLLALPFALGTAVSSANTPFQYLHHVIQSCLAGTAVFAIADLFFHMHNAFHPLFRYTFLVALLGHMALTLLVARNNKQVVKYGRYTSPGIVAIGHLLLFVLAWAWLPQTWFISAVLVIIGLYFIKFT